MRVRGRAGAKRVQPTHERTEPQDLEQERLELLRGYTPPVVVLPQTQTSNPEVRYITTYSPFEDPIVG